MPKIDSNNKTRPYITILTNKQKPYQEMLDSGKYIAVSTFLRDGDFIEAQARALLQAAHAQGMDLKQLIGTWLPLIRAKMASNAEKGMVDARLKPRIR